MSWAARVLSVLLLASLCLGAAGDIPAPETMIVGTSYLGRILVPNNQILTPAGQRVTLPDLPKDIAVSPKGDMLAVRLVDALNFYSIGGELIRSMPLNNSSFMGLDFSSDGRFVAVSQIGAIGVHSIALVPTTGAGNVLTLTVPNSSIPSGLALDQTASKIYVALNQRNTVAQIDVNTGRILKTVPVGVAPLGVALTPAGDRLFVTNWGGRRPQNNESKSPSAGTDTLVDLRGIASSGTVTVIDVAQMKVIAEIPVGLHPSGIRISPDGFIAVVANSNSDTVTLIDTRTLATIDTISIPSYPQGYIGSSPTAVEFGPTGQWLYVTCGGNNAVAVLQQVSTPQRPSRSPKRAFDSSTYALRGFVPTDWYPMALAVARADDVGERVYVVNNKGIGVHGQSPFNVKFNSQGSLTIFPGGISSVATSDAVSFSNDPFRDTPIPPDSPRDLRSLGVDHVFLIIKENRTYDQVLGDLDRGNGDPSMATYGWDITPNQHALAAQFVTLDNFFTSGRVSADGHQWLTQATNTAYLERGQGTYVRSYPYSGEDPLAFASTGFIWNAAQKAGLTVRLFGEFTLNAAGVPRPWSEYLADSVAPTRQLSVQSRSSFSALDPIIEPDYPAFRLDVPDVFRARVFIEKFNNFVQQGTLPNLIVIQLPGDHAVGVTPGSPTPQAMIADNDLATGRIVEAISHSSVWPRSAVFITEDDAQDGWDHVDGHRTICLFASPFVRRGGVDSTHYNQTSVLRTIEALLGLSPMNKFDASALPMNSIFVTQPDYSPTSAQQNRVPLDSFNPPLGQLSGAAKVAARQSMAMNFIQIDAAPEDLLNQILWHTAKGWNTPYPSTPHGPDCPVDDD